MKKTLLLVAAAVALVACSNEETVRQSAPEAIGFDNAFVENSTRSVNDPSFDADNMFSDFAVYGFVEGAVLFDGTAVSKSINNTDLSSEWKYAGTQYWIAGANYNFNAVAPLTDGGWTKTAATKDATTLAFTNDGTTDLLYAYAAAEGQAENNQPVAFTFRHTLSKVKFSFTNGYNATNATIRVKNIQITDAYATGNVVLSDATVWSEQAGDLTLNFGNAALTAEDNAATATENDKGLALAYNDTIESYNELFMIPGASDTDATVENADNTTTTYTDVYTVKFTVELLVSDTEVKEYTHTVYTTFAPVAGNSYDIAATITAENIDPEHAQEPIEFTVTAINDWGNGNTTDTNDPADGVNDVYPIN